MSVLQEKYINDPEVLIAAAESAGLSGAREFVSDPNAGLQEVQQNLGKYPGISGVPHFIINHR